MPKPSEAELEALRASVEPMSERDEFDAEPCGELADDCECAMATGHTSWPGSPEFPHWCGSCGATWRGSIGSPDFVPLHFPHHTRIQMGRRKLRY